MAQLDIVESQRGCPKKFEHNWVSYIPTYIYTPPIYYIYPSLSSLSFQRSYLLRPIIWFEGYVNVSSNNFNPKRMFYKTQTT